MRLIVVYLVLAPHEQDLLIKVFIVCQRYLTLVSIYISQMKNSIKHFYFHILIILIPSFVKGLLKSFDHKNNWLFVFLLYSFHILNTGPESKGTEKNFSQFMTYCVSFVTMLTRSNFIHLIIVLLSSGLRKCYGLNLRSLHTSPMHY